MVFFAKFKGDEVYCLEMRARAHRRDQLNKPALTSAMIERYAVTWTRARPNAEAPGKFPHLSPVYFACCSRSRRDWRAQGAHKKNQWRNVCFAN